MKILIVKKSDLSIQSEYDSDAPDQSRFGGPWGNSNECEHIEVPSEINSKDVSLAMVEGVIEVSEDLDKKDERIQSERNEKLAEMRKIRDNRLSGADSMVNELVLAIRVDTQAVKDYRQALLDITTDYKYVLEPLKAKVAIDAVDLEDEAFWPDEPV